MQTYKELITCNKSVELNNFVASCQQAVDNLSTSREQAVRTHPIDKLLEQHCYKSAAGLLQLVHFYVCRRKSNLFPGGGNVIQTVYKTFITWLQESFAGHREESGHPVTGRCLDCQSRFV